MEREIFISYSRHDLKRVKVVKEEIERETGVECWMDLEGIESSNPNFVKAIVTGIVECKVFIFMLSEKSQISDYALGEIDLARNEKKEIVFINIDGCLLTREFRLVYGRSNIISWNNEAEHDKLLRDLKKWLRRDALEVGQQDEAPQPNSVNAEEDEEQDLLYNHLIKLRRRTYKKQENSANF